MENTNSKAVPIGQGENPPELPSKEEKKDAVFKKGKLEITGHGDVVKSLATRHFYLEIAKPITYAMILWGSYYFFGDHLFPLLECIIEMWGNTS